jgi:hypothetical protein
MRLRVRLRATVDQSCGVERAKKRRFWHHFAVGKQNLTILVHPFSIRRQEGDNPEVALKWSLVGPKKRAWFAGLICVVE